MYTLRRATRALSDIAPDSLASLQDWLIDRSYTLPRNAEKALERNGVRAARTK